MQRLERVRVQRDIAQKIANAVIARKATILAAPKMREAYLNGEDSYMVPLEASTAILVRVLRYWGAPCRIKYFNGQDVIEFKESRYYRLYIDTSAFSGSGEFRRLDWRPFLIHDTVTGDNIWLTKRQVIAYQDESFEEFQDYLEEYQIAAMQGEHREPEMAWVLETVDFEDIVNDLSIRWDEDRLNKLTDWGK